MKTKEIDVWITIDRYRQMLNNEFETGYYSLKEEGTGDEVKAKLIIEIPEKKIEITESQFDVAFFCNSIRDYKFKDEVHLNAVKLNKVKKELGF